MKDKFLVRSAWKMATVDNYETGEDPETTQHIDLPHMTGLYDDLEAFIEMNGLPELKHWYVFEDGRIECTRLEHDSGDELTSLEMERWREGAFQAWSATYSFWIQMIEGIDHIETLVVIREYR